jgi:RNA polymerase sigma-70 factor (ECF subfamily)
MGVTRLPGDDGFDEWVAPHLAVLAALAARRVGPADADDVVQETLVRAWRRRATFRPEQGTARAWLVGILLDRARRHRTRTRPAELIDRPPDHDPAPDAPQALMIGHLDLERAIAALPQRQREVIWLHYLADLPVAEIAMVLGISTGSVKTRADPEHYDPSVCRSPVTAVGSLTGPPAEDSAAYLIRADYASGPSVTVVVRLGLCGDLGASNGTRTGQRPTELAEWLSRIAGSWGGFPSDVHPAVTGRVTGRLLASGMSTWPVPGTVILTNTETTSNVRSPLPTTDASPYPSRRAPTPSRGTARAMTTTPAPAGQRFRSR